jgi:hypothetical protein
MHEYEAIIAKLPDSDAPAVFGLPDNIERRSVLILLLLDTQYHLSANFIVVLKDCVSSVMCVVPRSQRCHDCTAAMLDVHFVVVIRAASRDSVRLFAYRVL